MTLRPLLAKDARLLVRNRPLLVALVLYPLLLAAVLGAAFREAPQKLDLVVVDDDPGGTLEIDEGETLTTQDLWEAAGPSANVRRVDTEAEALAILRRGEADAALLVPRGFLRDLSALGGNATLRLVVDESDPVRAGVARNAVEGAIEGFVKSVVQRKVQDVLVLLNLTVEGGTTRIAFVDVDILGIDRARARLDEVRGTLDPGSEEARKVREVVTFLDFARTVLGESERYLVTTAMPLRVQASGLAAQETPLAAVALPGAIVLGVFWTGALAAALLAARERETGVARRLVASPAPRALQVASKTLVALAAALLPALLLVAVGIVLFGLPLRPAPLALVVLLVASLAAAALGALCAGLGRATSAAALLAVLLLLPMLLLGGLFYPVAYMPPAAQAVAKVLPVTLATDALRGALLRGSPFAELLAPLGGLVLFALLAAGAGALLARRDAG